ncbi:DNA replication protein [Pichia californica]|uniref:DNA replication complex GINS protein PSF3 n=1 Tax=Pichia californica TaxID=460514 RepID=A0A9P6WL20_9ASCO|nr:DNA replication protein [[Candida] californica]KAG0688916.1 DNA replication protein [[Candida] californica]
MGGGYFDLDDILSESQKFTGSFKYDVDNVGCLINSKDSAKISKQDKLELPFWLVEALTRVRIGEEDNDEIIFAVERPEYLSKIATNFFKASPLNADLSTVPHFYKVVKNWCEFIEQPELIEIVFNMLVSRASKINDLSLNTSEMHSRENVEFIQTFDAFEKELFQTSAESYGNSRAWIKNIIR